MSFDRAKALQSAQKYLAKGQLDRAITEYERLVQADPKDARLLLKLGDIYTRQGATKDAAATYRKVAEQYAEQGFFLKAVAVYKQILKLDPAQTDVWERLAEMYEMLSLVSDAISTYEQVADAYTRTSSPRKALRALQKCADLDPENVAARIRYAEALSKLNKPEEAARAFHSGAELLKRQGRVDDYLKVGERLLFHQADNYEFARELAATYLDRSDAKHALAKLQPCFNADPKNLDTLMLLARAFEQLGQTPKTVSVLKEVARLHATEARHAEQGSVLKRILSLDPQDAEARRDLSEIKHLPNDQSSSAIEVGDEDYDLLLEDDESNLVEESPASTPPEMLDEAGTAKVKRLLDECAVFIRYGLTEKMITQLQEVLSLDPRNIEAREKLKDAFLKARRPSDAAGQLIALSELVAKQDPDRAEEYLSEAIRIDPQNERAKRHLSLLGGAGAKAEDDEVVLVEDAASEPPPRAAAPGRAKRRRSERPEESFASVMPESDDEVDDTVEIAEGDDIEMIVEEGSVVAPLEDEEDAVMVVEESVAAPFPTPSPEFEPEPEPVPLSQRMAAPTTDRPSTGPRSARPTTISDRPGVPVPEALREALEEIDFYLKQGMTDEAESTLADTLESYPDHPLLLAKQRALAGEPPLSEPPPPAPDSPPPPAAVPREALRGVREDRSFELAQKLAEEVAPPSSSSSQAVEVADVIAQFKQGVARQVDKGDSATHYDLGIAYMEMGLHAEAIDEFKLCLGDPTRRCTAHTMIGLSYVAKGDMELGVDHFKHALDENPRPEEELGLWFEMGNAYELLRKNIDALVWYEKVEERDPHFRDVIQRIERLGAARTPQQESDEFDEMFDNMILKE